MNKSNKRRDIFKSHKPGEYSLDISESACQLLALYLADEPVHKLIAKIPYPGITARYPRYRQSTIVKLLIEIATAYRLTSWRLTKKRKEEISSQVGILFQGEEVDKHTSLGMHESCNKIIHADEILFETRKIRNIPLAYYNREQIHTSGTHRGNEWHACIWIPEFCNAALTMPYSALDPDDVQF